MDLKMNLSKKKAIWIIVLFVIAAVIIIAIYFTSSILGSRPQQSKFTLQIIHFNDFHAHFEETSPTSTTCKSEMTNCIGGFSRLYAAVMNLTKLVPHSLVLNAGDNFVGTMWYNIFKWNITQHFLNLLPLDAITLGNHEFDDGISGVVPFIKALKFPVVVANINDTFEPTFKNICQKSITVLRNGRKIGIIGVVTTTTQTGSRPEKLIFLDEIESVRSEAQYLKLDQKCDIIVVVSHCGTAIDRNIALQAGEYINVIVGGHSHSLYYHGEKAPGFQVPEQDYPYIIERPDGKNVFIVQSSCNTKYVGHLILDFDENNTVLSWRGNSIYLDTHLPQDEMINEDLLSWKSSIEKEMNSVVGSTLTKIDRKNCLSGECLAGNFLTSTMIYAWNNNLFGNNDSNLAHGPIALMHPKGIRGNLEAGNITSQDLFQMLPFDNSIISLEMKGENILELLEYGVDPFPNSKKYESDYFLQVDGLQFVVNFKKPFGSRIENIKVFCNCENPMFEPLNKNETYRILAPSFIVNGGSGFYMFEKYGRNKFVGLTDTRVAIEYLKNNSPISVQIDGRIEVIK